MNVAALPDGIPTQIDITKIMNTDLVPVETTPVLTQAVDPVNGTPIVALFKMFVFHDDLPTIANATGRCAEPFPTGLVAVTQSFWRACHRPLTIRPPTSAPRARPCPCPTPRR